VNGPIRVLCVDDNRLMAEALKRRLAFEPGIEWGEWVEDGTLALQTAMSIRPDVVLLDLDMPGHDTFEIARSIVGSLPSAKVVMFSGHVQSEYIHRAIDAGAWGYVSKGETLDDVILAIRRVAAGEFVLTPEVDGECGRPQ